MVDTVNPSEEVLASLTSAKLERVIAEIVAERHPGERGSIAVGSIAERLLAGCEFDTGAERIRMQARLARAIEILVAAIDGLHYVKND